MLNQHKWFEPLIWRAGCHSKIGYTTCICGAILETRGRRLAYLACIKSHAYWFDHINQIPDCPLSDDDKLIKEIIC